MINQPSIPQPSEQHSKSWYLSVWRWHFYMGLYVVPFLIMLSVTGLLLMYIAFFDGRYGDGLMVEKSGIPQSIAVQTEPVLKTFPDGKIVEWIAPRSNSSATIFHVKVNDTTHVAAVDPYQATVLDTWVKDNSWYEIITDIHGTLFIGKLGDRLIEIAAGFGIILIISGLYLWWPRHGKTWKNQLIPNLFGSKREVWKSLHGTLGLYFSLILLVFWLTGLAWAGVWGGKYVQAWSTTVFPAGKWGEIPLSDTATYADMNDGKSKDVPWGLEQTPLPISGSNAGLSGLPKGQTINADNIATFAKTLAFSDRFHIRYPKNDTGVWTIKQDSMSADSTDPSQDRSVHIDQYSGKILGDITYHDYSLAAKAMGYGIAFHEGFMGIWNLVLNTLFCLSMIVLSVSGIVMWWMRRPKSSWNFSAPPVPKHIVPLTKGLMIIVLGLSFAFPLVGITLLSILFIDFLILSRIPLLKQFFA